jgi:hypothetical protein
MRARYIGPAIGVVAALLWLGNRGRNRRRNARPPITPSTSPRNAADVNIGPPGRNLESRLDEALEESFPASDPVSVHIE